MPMYDRTCPNGHRLLDRLEPIRFEAVVPCPECGRPTERAWLSKPAAVIGDDIPGGELIHHGICNPDGSPRRYYSKSEMRQEAARRGLVNHVTHVPAHRGTDKSKHTSRWI